VNGPPCRWAGRPRDVSKRSCRFRRPTSPTGRTGDSRRT